MISPGKVALEQIHFPDPLVNVNLQAVLTQINNSVQMNLQQVAIITAQTSVLVTEVLTHANYTRARAEIQGNYTVKQATIQSNRFSLNAQTTAFSLAASRLQLNESEMTQFVRLWALRHTDSLMTYGSFNPLVNFPSTSLLK